MFDLVKSTDSYNRGGTQLDHFSWLLRKCAIFNHTLSEGRADGGTFSGRFVCLAAGLLLALCIPPPRAKAQDNAPSEPARFTVQLYHLPEQGQPGAPVSITLKEALERAEKSDPTFFAAGRDAKSAHEDSAQARAALLPNFQYSLQFLGTQGNGAHTTIGRFVTNDGVHVYRAWLMMHQDLSPGTFMATAYHRATSAEAMANAKAEIARRGLTVATTKFYYTLVVAQHKYDTAKRVLDEAQHLFKDRTTPPAEPAKEGAEKDEAGGAAAESAKAAASSAKEAADSAKEAADSAKQAADSAKDAADSAKKATGPSKLALLRLQPIYSTTA
jgi:hypothetical protein